eukprot:GEMP01007518.1.p1 GENE.GEMP01007518.1~~GEMP01007518.1.p1  ORF type:complete len:919 (+),score=142.27 GEMP01007518.1:539-3295(+)
MGYGISRGFRAWGKFSGENPWASIMCSFVVVLALSAGYSMQEKESRPEKMWVPLGAAALDHKDYVDTNWPADAGIEMYIATCGTGTTNCNILEPTRLKEIFRLHINFYKTPIDGSLLAKKNKANYKHLSDDSETDPAVRYGDKTWVVDKNLYPGDHPGPLHSKCSLWNDNTCDTTNIFWSLFDGDLETGAHPKNPNFFDSHYTTLQQVLDRVNAYVPNKQRGQSHIESILGQITKNANGDIVGATHLFHSWGMTNIWVRNKQNRRTDLVNLELEYQGLCGLGYDSNLEDNSCRSLATVDKSKVDISPFFQRSLPDAFRTSILDDLSSLIIAYALIICYMAIQLGKRDSVHSMLGLAFVAILLVACSMMAGLGFGFFIGQKESELVQLLWFLILGLGVDDAFVLVNEFNRATKTYPDKSIPQRISLTAETAGHSILVTSITDALAFIVGSLTILPALRGFCIFAGIAVLMCFLLQMTVFLPCIAINAARTQANRRDIFCCTKPAITHTVDKPLGCCGCLPGEPYYLERIFIWYANFMLQTLVRFVVILLFLGLLGGGLSGIVQFEMDFKIEWLIPDDKKIQDFIRANDEIFGQAQRAAVYISKETDHYAERQAIVDIGTYIREDAMFKPQQSRSWALSFETHLAAQPGIDVSTEAKYYTQLHTWLQPGSTGNIHEKMIQWKDKNDPAQGVFDSKMITTLKFEYTKNGKDRFNALEKFRKECDRRVKGSFPYTFLFLFWEEAGIVMQELIRNLIIAGGCIVVVIFLLIWNVKVSLIVCLSLVFSIMEVIGFAHYWDVTANSTSVIFILLCVGLTVDYSAHVAHMFRISHGTALERAKGSLIRIGPSVFNALMSTFLAVIVLSNAGSFAFRTFFKILFLTNIIGGLHGLLWLPVVLSFFGGSNFEEPAELQNVVQPKVEDC